MFRDEPKIAEAFRSGGGVGWHEHDPLPVPRHRALLPPRLRRHLISEWMPALDGVVAKLERGAKVADVGCGHGASTILMAQAFPKSTLLRLRLSPPSIEPPRKAAADAGVADRVTFEVAAAKISPASDYDLVAFFDCLHDMGDPVGAAAHVRAALAPDGTWLIVEPFAGDD